MKAKIELVNTFTGFKNYVKSVIFSSTNKYMAACDGVTATIWDLSTGMLYDKADIEGKLITFACNDRMILYKEKYRDGICAWMPLPNDNDTLWNFSAYINIGNYVSVADGGYIFADHHDNYANNNEKYIKQVRSGLIANCVFNYFQNEIRQGDWGGGIEYPKFNDNSITEKKYFYENSLCVLEMAVSPSLKYLAVAYMTEIEKTEKIRIYDILSGEILYEYSVNDILSQVIGFDFSECLYFTQNDTVYIIDLKDGKKLKKIQLDNYKFEWSLKKFSCDCSILVNGDLSGKIKIFSLENGKMILELVGHSSEITCINFSADGKYLACADNFTVSVWRIKDSEKFGVIEI